MKKIAATALAAIMAVSMIGSFAGCARTSKADTAGTAAQTQEAEQSGLTGVKLDDFTVKTISGDEFSLSEVLKDKKAVMINLWASWCGPCESEFPYMQEAYEKYKDDVEILALSVESTDTDELLADYVKSHKMTFPVANDSAVGLGDKYAKEAVPATLLVDRFGTVVYYAEGAATSTEEFTSIFDQVIGDDYTESRVLKAASQEVTVTAERLDSKTLSDAANAEGGTLVFDNAAEESIWPMAVRKTDGRTVLASTNKGIAESRCEVKTSVKAKKDDVLAFDFHISSEPVTDVLEVVVDGKVIKTLAGDYDWTAWGIELDKGTHEVIFRYDRPFDTSKGDDEVLLDNVRIASGSEAKAILSALPSYPVSDRAEIQVTNKDAKEIVFELKPGEFAEEGEDIVGYSCDSYYIVPSDTANIRFTLTSDYDPGAAHGYNFSSYEYTPVTWMKTDGDAYTIDTLVSSKETDGNSFSAFYVFPIEEGRMFEREEYDKLRGVMLFKSEADVESFIKEMKDDGFAELVWHYADKN